MMWSELKALFQLNYWRKHKQYKFYHYTAYPAGPSRSVKATLADTTNQTSSVSINRSPFLSRILLAQIWLINERASLVNNYDRPGLPSVIQFVRRVENACFPRAGIPRFHSVFVMNLSGVCQSSHSPMNPVKCRLITEKKACAAERDFWKLLKTKDCTVFWKTDVSR